MATIVADGDILRVRTDRYAAAVTTTGYTSGVLSGSFVDLATGARDLGHGLLIADFLLEPGEDSPDTPEALRYHHGDALHGTIAKRYVELPQICTQARRLPYEIVQGAGFVAVRQWFEWATARPPYVPGSRWEQWLLFPDGQRWFVGCERITSANDVDALIFRGDYPGHLKHRGGDSFQNVYLSYEGVIPSAEFRSDFAPDEAHFYQRDDARLPERMIRGYQTAEGPWLACLTLDPGAVWEAWCHQRGYVCLIMEIGGRPVAAGQSFGAVHLVGWFDDPAEMAQVYDHHRGARELHLRGRSWTLV